MSSITALEEVASGQGTSDHTPKQVDHKSNCTSGPTPNLSGPIQNFILRSTACGVFDLPGTPSLARYTPTRPPESRWISRRALGIPRKTRFRRASSCRGCRRMCRRDHVSKSAVSRQFGAQPRTLVNAARHRRTYRQEPGHKGALAVRLTARVGTPIFCGD
jgi:hypothetical protein